MFLFLRKFDWSFSHLPRLNWNCWTLPKCSYFTQMFLILPKTLLKFFGWPKFDEGYWNYHMIPVHSRAVFILPSGAKKNRKIVSDYFAVWSLLCHWFGYYFASVWKMNTTSLTCECSCILCPNFENFCPNNGQFFSVGDVTASPAFPCRTLMTSGNHGSIWANFCSPSKTTKLVQVSIGLPERASKKCSYCKKQLSTWTLTNS